LNLPVNLLAFDTSTPTLAVGARRAAFEATEHAPGGAAASAALLPLVATVLQRAGLERTQLQAIAFGQGPGAFTGLRTSCAVAQGLGLGLNCPLLPINSLLIVAEDAWQQNGQADGDYAVIMDARLGEAYAARWRRVGADWLAAEPGALMALPALAQAWQGRPVGTLAGSGIAAFPAWVAALQPTRCVAQEHNRAAALLRLAAAAWARGEAVDAALALPVYWRDKVAQTSAEREAARAA
jgi:tRNA threonylcarbamoyladenosine biosynthesis protein TsaB